ncbi:MAG: hypothetical protein ACOY3M_02490 [Patescibacteria group bacterium]
MGKYIALLGVIALIFFAGSAAARTAKVDLSAGPNAEGNRAVLEAQAEYQNAQTDAERQMAEFKLNEAKEQAEGKRQAAIARANMWQKALMFGGSFFLVWTLLFGAINIMAAFGIWNYRVLTKANPVRNGQHVMWNMPVFPFMLIHTDDYAPSYTGMIMPGKRAEINAHPQIAVFSLARMLGADTKGQERLGTLVMITKQLGHLLNGDPIQRTEIMPYDDKR